MNKKTSFIICLIYFLFVCFYDHTFVKCSSSRKMSNLRNAFGKRSRPIVLIDPAGHAGDLGRLLLEGYERAQTLRFAYALKKELLKKYKVCPVISRSSGERILPLQVPSFSNRLMADFFLRIHMYREESEKPKLFLYHHAWEYSQAFSPIIEMVLRNSDVLSLVPLHQAHFSSIGRTKFYGKKIYEYLSQDYFSRYFDIYQPRGIPLKSLVGITAPAISLEIGICRENKWKSLIGPIVESLSFLIV